MIFKKKNIQQILLFSISSIFFILCATFLLALLIKKKQNDVFKESSKAQLNRSIELYLNVKENFLKSILLDYTFWDEMVDFVKKPTETWSTLNLDATLNSFRVEGLWVIDTNKRVVYSKNDPSCPELNNFPLSTDIFATLFKQRYIHTFYYNNSTLIEILGSTIHPSNDPQRLTVPSGYMFYARVWNKTFLKEFSEVTASQILLKSNLPPEDNDETNDISVTKTLQTFTNNTAPCIVVTKKFNGFILFNRFSRIFLTILFIASLLIISVLFYIASKYIKRPLTIIETSLKTNNIEEAKELNKYTSEFEQIGTLIANFIIQKDELEKAKLKAEESERLKSAFLANMSHEIRSPLNGIIGFSELISELKTDEKTTRFAHYISIRSQDLLRIINDILDFSRIEAQQLEVINEKFLLLPLLNDLEGMYGIIDNKPENKTKVTFIKNDDIQLNTDKLRLKQIFINLIDNAVKFTENGTVEVGYNIGDEFVEFYVKDDGIGIPADKVSIIFDRFRQINEVTNSRYGGNGLGLSICKGLLELMKGNIWVISDEGKGSVFHFTIPLNQ